MSGSKMKNVIVLMMLASMLSPASAGGHRGGSHVSVGHVSVARPPTVPPLQFNRLSPPPQVRPRLDDSEGSAVLRMLLPVIIDVLKNVIH